MKLNLENNWFVLQDVHDTGETLGIFNENFDFREQGHQISEFEKLDELVHLQLLYSENPYFGRELRYYNHAPWWYKNEFFISQDVSEEYAVLKFTNVDYFCKVWFNGEYLGFHEGYSIPFEFDVSQLIKKGEKNTVFVKVWSPWDKEVYQNAYRERTFKVIRDLSKGTYEHDDTFIARDVNPVGIYGSVSLEFYEGIRFSESPFISYTLSDDLKTANVNIKANTVNQLKEKDISIQCIVIDNETNTKVKKVQFEVPGDGMINSPFNLENIKLWNTWDNGKQPLYQIYIQILKKDRIVHSISKRIGFRKVEMIRDKKQTLFILNGNNKFIRGTSYFPDVYISKMNKERYLRDLHALKNAGFNTIRIHVHVEQPILYELCDELGIAIMQDSEYNWTHPIESDWSERFVNIFAKTIKMLNDHPSIINWICLNEPGLKDPEGQTYGYAMEVSPGPQLYEVTSALDPSRPIIKGSFCEDDLLSGDSHNYTGSLSGEDTHYTDIWGTKEKLNTEFGFDAPGSVSNIATVKPLYKRLENIIDDIDTIQYYQYRLTKYFIEHYRIQKYQPCSGYVHFMFIDLCPQSFYGVYDWWGIPKMGLQALMESNQPLGVFLEQSKDQAKGIWVVNDLNKSFGTCKVEWIITNDDHQAVKSGEKSIIVDQDSRTYVSDIDLNINENESYHVSLVVRNKEGDILISNKYTDAFNHPPHVKGHPSGMNHEIGVRLYHA